MRAHRRFQPMLDSLPYRITPSSTAVATAAVQGVTVVALDTDSPETGGSTPIIIAPPQTPGTLPC